MRKINEVLLPYITEFLAAVCFSDIFIHNAPPSCRAGWLTVSSMTVPRSDYFI